MVSLLSRRPDNRYMGTTKKPPKDWGTELGRRIRQALKDSGRTQVDLADTLGVTRQAVQSWLTTGRVHKDKLEPIALFTRKDLDYFLTKNDGTKLTTVSLGDEDYKAVREFLSLTAEARAWLLGLAKNKDERLVETVIAYVKAGKVEQQLIHLVATKGAQILRDDLLSSDAAPRGRKPHRKRS